MRLGRSVCASLAALFAFAGARPVLAQCDLQPMMPSGLPTIGEFGYVVATDGVTIVIGARGDDAAGTDSGSVKVFEETGGAWAEVISLIPGDAEAMDNFGTTVTVDGDWLAAGSPFDDDKGNGAGAVYLYKRVGGVWTFDIKLTPPNLFIGDNFGSAISLDGLRLAVGTPGDDDMGSDSGSVYLFEHNGSAWMEQQKVVAADGSSDDEFGSAVDVSGDRVLIGSRFDNPQGIDSGSAYVFEYSAARSWDQVAKLTTLSGA